MSDIPFFISLNFCPPLLQELVHDQQMRTQMKDRLKKSQQATTSNPVPLLPGDRVLCRQTQYKSNTGHGKFQEFTVVSMSGGLAKLQDAVGHTTLDLCKNRCSKCFRECSRQQMSQSVCLHLQQKNNLLQCRRWASSTYCQLSQMERACSDLTPWGVNMWQAWRLI